MRIYKINIEHIKYGSNYKSENVQARTFEEAIKQVKKNLQNRERIYEIEVLAEADY